MFLLDLFPLDCGIRADYSGKTPKSRAILHFTMDKYIATFGDESAVHVRTTCPGCRLNASYLATLAAFRPGRVLPIMMATLSIDFSFGRYMVKTTRNSAFPLIMRA